MGRIVFDPDVPVADQTRRACSVTSRTSGESLAGVTSGAPQAWLVIEDDGPWPATNARRDESLPVRLRNDLDDLGVRLQYVRRPGRRPRAEARGGERFVGLAWAARGDSWLETTTMAEPWDSVDRDVLTCLGAGERPGLGTQPPAPLVLACTHGRVDPCCARYGRPVAAALADAFGPMVWETSHVGGCRFAANILLLPDGVMYGHGDPDRAVTNVGSYLAGRLVDDPGLRGQPGVPQPVQVAELAVRRATGVWGLHDLEATVVSAGEDRHRVRVEVAGHGASVVDVVTERLPERPYGCGDDRTWTPQHWQVAALRPA